MKKIVLLTLSLILLAGVGQAQDLESYMELLRSDIRTDKVAMITEVMDFSDVEGEIFWPIHREYQLELDKLGDAYLAVINDYADNYMSLTDDKAEELTKKALDIRKDRLDLQKKYIKKISKELSPVRAARWAQLENQISLIVELQLVSAIPFAVHGAGD